jgi:hypothetical protein
LRRKEIKIKSLKAKIAKLERVVEALGRDDESRELSNRPRSTGQAPGSRSPQRKISPKPKRPRSTGSTDFGTIQRGSKIPLIEAQNVPVVEELTILKTKKRPAPPPPKASSKGVQTADPDLSADTLAQSTATGAKKKRNLPKTAGSSLQSTRAARESEESDQPVFTSQPRRVNRPVVNAGGNPSVARPTITFAPCSSTGGIDKVPVDNDLYGYLIYQFMFYPRTPDLFLQMAAKAKLWLKDFDTTMYTHEELHQRVVSAVTAAMVVPNCEVAARKVLQEPVSDKQRHDYSAMVRQGVLGSVAEPLFCFLSKKRNLTLPTKA